MKKLPPLYLIDAYGLIYRSYFAFLTHPLRNSGGKNISALFGFMRTLVSLLDEGAPAAGGATEKPLVLAAVLDSRTPTFRHKMYSEYKATRQKAPADLHEQVPLVEEVLNALGVKVLRAEGYEADDIIATLARRCGEEGRQCYILSSDKDLLQLVGENVYELRPLKQGGNSGTGKGGGINYELVGVSEVKAEWGVGPEQVLDLLSLTGDSSDNVPGVRGVGEKTAVKLMTRYGSLDEIYRNIAGIEGAVGKKLAEGKESAYFSKKLIQLEYRVPFTLKSIDELSVEILDRESGAKILRREGVFSVAKALDGGKGAGSADGGGDRVSGGPARVPVDSALRGEGIYRAIIDLKELEKLLAAAAKQKFMALDFETDSLDAWNAHPVGISLAIKPKEAFYVPLAVHGGDSAFLEPGKVRALLLPLFADADMTLIAHNAKYDYKVSRGWGIERWKCRIWDTMVAAWLADPERNNYSLDSLAAYALDAETIAYNDIVPKGSTFNCVSLETAVRYSGEDADLCLRMKLHLEQKLLAAGAMDLFTALEMPLLPILAEMEGLGIRIEGKVLGDYGQELSTELNKIQDQCWTLVGHEFNLGSPKQLQTVLFEERKLKPGKKTKTGYSTDESVLEELALEDPLPAMILRHRTMAKLKSTYVDTLPGQADREGRIHTNFVQTGTATGRLSSREPNLQNIPIRDEEGRHIREAFVASPGQMLISADYSQIELVILAHLSQDPNLNAAFGEGKDVHTRTAALIFGIPEDKVQSAERRIAKTINFGVMYGMSAFRLANELGISRTEAKSFIDVYFATYAGVRKFIGELIRKTEETGYASTIFGRRRYIPAINSRNKTEKAAADRIAVNTPIQGSAADIVKQAMIKLDRRLVKEKSPARLLLQVHDELILECPGAEAGDAAALVKEEMEKAVSLSIPLRVSVETGKCWGDFH
ncbi:MAG: DNA polymerase I [Treponema sp.]|jgi:DNA polymerase-1|nr:DNA polymerase I [Treponema sp.]